MIESGENPVILSNTLATDVKRRSVLVIPPTGA